MPVQGQISENSRRIAKNTLLLYFRMFVLMLIGLFTSRIVLKALGVNDFGIYNAVGDVVIGFTFITGALSAAIVRYMAAGLGEGNPEKQKKIFSASIIIQLAFSVLIIILVATVGTWLLHHKMQIPEGRMGAAETVLVFSAVVLMLNMMSVPYNATIIAHERMGVFAVISIVEGVLKLSVALLLLYGFKDNLIAYSLMMAATALIVRMSYGIYCRRCFAEARGMVAFDKSLIKEIAGFAGWSFFGSSAFVFNTRFVNILVNVFFGVAVNAARGVASQVEGVLKNFVSNFLTALNPQITKSWASGDKEYCFELVRKGSKYTFWMLLLMFIPIAIWAEPLLRLWLGNVPEHAALFTRLVLLCLIVDMAGNTLVTLIQATGNVKRYYIITGTTSFLCLPLTWLAFRLGAGAEWAYLCFICVYLVVFTLRLYVINKQTGFPVGRYLRSFFGITPGERAFVFRKVSRFLPDRIFLREKFRIVFGFKPDFNNPSTFNEFLQAQKLTDRNPLYRTLVDKADVKAYVSEKIGADYVIPTFGIWDSVEEIDWDALPESFVLKCTHDSGSAILCSDKSLLDKDAACESLKKTLSREFYSRDREWAYKGLKPRIIAEKYLGPDLADYKFFCSQGSVRFLYVATDRSSRTEETKFDFFDPEYYHLDVRNGHPNSVVPPKKPICFEQMKQLACRLSEGMPQVRIDFYEIDGKIYFGEFTFYHMGGFVPFEPQGWDYTFREWIR